MSIAKRNMINNITRLISDEILREQMIDLHLGKLSDEDVQRIREEREKEAEEILQMFPKIDYTITSPAITNTDGQAETRNCGDGGDKDIISIN